MTAKKRPFVLCILDGWGERSPAPDNTIKQAKTPNWDDLWQKWPHALLNASEEAVGLPSHQMGNSEVGHMTLGAGRIIEQDLPRIDHAIAAQKIETLPSFQNFLTLLRQTKGTCHLIGLLSPGGVHSHQDHIIAIAQLLAKHAVPVAIHGILDGRDTPPKSALNYLNSILKQLEPFPHIHLATLSGRYYAMDRDQRWERIAKAYSAICLGEGPIFKDPLVYVEQCYQEGKSDEFLIPACGENYEGIQATDGVFIANFRADRVRQIIDVMHDPDPLRPWVSSSFLQPLSCKAWLGMTDYAENYRSWLPALFPPHQINNTLGEVISQQGLRQMRIAETEKYAHVTFFFNGGKEEPLLGEERLLIPSPKVSTYDLMPEMSAFEITHQVMMALKEKRTDFILVNYANADMIGHTGNQNAAIKAVEVIDTCLGQLVQALESVDGILMITADHGNIEMMWDESTRSSHTAHTCSPVPVLLINDSRYTLKDGGLSDVAPTILKVLDIPIPQEMTGQLLLDDKRSNV